MSEVGTTEWIDALATSVATVDAGELDLTVLHRVTDGPAWAITAAAGRVTVAPAPHDRPADVTFTWQADDVAAVAAGTLAPLAVFQAGRLRVGGDLRRLADATELFATFPGVPA